jgi:hypothetical protein
VDTRIRNAKPARLFYAVERYHKQALGKFRQFPGGDAAEMIPVLVGDELHIQYWSKRFSWYGRLLNPLLPVQVEIERNQVPSCVYQPAQIPEPANHEACLG